MKNERTSHELTKCFYILLCTTSNLTDDTTVYKVVTNVSIYQPNANKCRADRIPQAQGERLTICLSANHMNTMNHCFIQNLSQRHWELLPFPPSKTL